MRPSRLLLGTALGVAMLLPPPSSVYAADPCQTAIVKSLAKYKKIYLKSHAKCLDRENRLLIPAGSCPDATAQTAIGKADLTVNAKIAAACASVAQITSLGYRSDCAYEAATQGREGQCAVLPVTTTDQFAACMKCWKGAELSEYIAILNASNSVQECGGDLGEASPTCSDLDCTSPLPVQRELGDTGENDCQRGISKAGIKYLLQREKIIETCLLKGCTQAQCLAGTCAEAPTAPLKLEAAETQKVTLIKQKCGNRTPSPDAPGFCCQCGTGQACMNILDEATCLATSGCSVQTGKFCDVDLTCSPGPKTITWWNNCPESDTCPGAAVTTLDQLISCVDTTAVTVNDELLCLQFPGYPCAPPDPDTTTTTTTTVP